jgi:NAD(P)-dependent dehydrogenase (short-subunit alcohol dehydrogenase family)
MFLLTDKSAVITGAASGIGKAIAACLAKQGAMVHLIDLQQEATTAAAAEIAAGGGNASFYSCDVSNQQEVKNVFEQIAAVDILINCAGVAHIGNAGNTTEADMDRIYNINVKGTYNCIHIALPYLLKSKSPVILNVSSIVAHVGIPDRFAYSMSKGAMHAMTLSVARDYLKQGIRCNSISPARVHTPFVDGFLAKNYPGKEAEMFEKLSKSQPIGRMGKVEEVAALALYLCSDEAGFITGCDYPIDGGFMYINN